MKSDKYEPRVCVICGKQYKPGRINQCTCGDPVCVKAKRMANAREWQVNNYLEKKELRKKRKKPKADTMIAIGYADRQREQTLHMVGKVKVTL